MRKIIMAGLALILLSSSLIYAQGPGGPPERRREKLQDLAIWKMLEVLDLSQEQTDKFLPALREMQKQEARLQEERKKMFDELERAMTQGGGEKEVRQIISQVRQLGRQGEEIRERFFTQAESILTIQQLGRLVLFQDRFERRMRETMREMQEQRMQEMQEKER
jgi:hypothetical protein